MKQFDASNLIVHPGNSSDPNVVVEVVPEQVGLDYIHFHVRRLPAQSCWEYETGDHELAVVMLSGTVDVESNRGRWPGIGMRSSVFSGPPSALYLPRQTTFRVTATHNSEFAVAFVATDQDHAPRVITGDDIGVEIRGGDNATRQINGIIPPGFPCHRLVIVEVYTPGGNWSSYPPHKHDIHKTDATGTILEADLEETYYFKIDRPAGFAFQRVYTEPESPLHRAGFPIDAALLVHTDDVVLIPEGHHPVAAAPGYTTYYLNVLAGSAQSLANSEDPAHTWVKTTYQALDPRIPLYEASAKH
ncbi:MAG: 5-deoxy-glucuronate isomerase [Herpetosiphon sp.]